MIDERTPSWTDYFDEALTTESPVSTDFSLSIWEEDPVPFREFVESPLYLSSQPLSAKQYELLEPIVGYPPKTILTNQRAVKVMVLLLGKGSGKGYMSIVLEAYIVYLLMCLRDPVAFFGLASDTFLDMVNVALREAQAELNYFDRFREIVKKSPYFRRNYRISESGGSKLNQFATAKKGDIYLGALVVKFPKHVRAVAVPSKADSFEGGTVIFFVMDEASGFRTEKGLLSAGALFGSLITSTRNLPYVGVVSSFVRLDAAHDFTYRKYMEALETNDPSVSAVRMSPWEVLPELYGEPDTELVINRRTGESIMVPRMFADLVNTGKIPLDEFLARYLCIPYGGAGSSASRFIELSVVDWDVLLRDDPPAIMSEDMVQWSRDGEEEVKYLRKEISITSAPEPGVPYFMALDASESHADTALVLGHPKTTSEPEGMGVVVVIDAILIWSPDPDEGVSVDLYNVMDTIARINKAFRVQSVRMDHWNGAVMEQGLRSLGVRVNRANPSLNDYRLMAGYFEGLSVEIPRCREADVLKSQIYLLKPRGNSKPVPLFGKADVVDAVAGLVGAMHERMPHIHPSMSRRQSMGALFPKSSVSVSPSEILKEAMLERYGGGSSLSEVIRRSMWSMSGKSRMVGSAGSVSGRRRSPTSLEKGGLK